MVSKLVANASPKDLAFIKRWVSPEPTPAEMERILTPSEFKPIGTMGAQLRKFTFLERDQKSGFDLSLGYLEEAGLRLVAGSEALLLMREPEVATALTPSNFWIADQGFGAHGTIVIKPEQSPSPGSERKIHIHSGDEHPPQPPFVMGVTTEVTMGGRKVKLPYDYNILGIGEGELCTSHLLGLPANQPWIQAQRD